MKYIYYKTDGTVETLERDEVMTYKELSELVGGTVESSQAFEGANGNIIFLNEDGISENLDPNPFFTPLHQETFLGNIVEGKIDEEGNFIGLSYDEWLVYQKREVKAISPKLLEKDKIFTIIGIGGFMANTTRSSVKSTGIINGGNPVFKENIKGARKMFTLRNLKDKDVLIFEGVDLPLKIDGEVGNIIRGNALFNFHGDIDRIREFVKSANINPFFTAYDRINHISEDGKTETLVFMDRFASCKSVADRQASQLAREGHNVKVGVGFQIASL